MFLIMLADRVQNRKRRAIQPATDASCDLALTAAARQPSGAANDLVALVIFHLREIGPALHLIAMGIQKALDTAQQKSDAPLAIGIDEPPRRQPAPPPALDCFAGDIESLGDIVDAQHRLGQLARV